MPGRYRWVRWLLASWLALVLVDAQAQTMDDVVVLVQAEDVVVRINFNGPVRLLQQSPTGAAQLYQIRLDFTGMDPALLAQPVDETRQQAAAMGAPAFGMVLQAAPRQKLRQLALQFNETVSVRVRPGPTNRSLDIAFVGLASKVLAPAADAGASAPAASASAADGTVGAPAAAAPADAASAPVLTEIDVKALAELDKAREAMAAKQNDRATEILNRLLRLPPNAASQDAQELVGLAWERVGDVTRARTEYELYLKLFKTGDGADRVTQRLAAIDAAGKPVAAAGTAAAAPATPAPKPNQKSLNGNIAQYYFGGKARSQSLVNLPSGIDQSTLTKTTESALVTSLDLGGRYAWEDADLRFTVRGTGATNLAKSSRNASSVNAAYVDYRQPSSGLALRMGRQSAINGGLLGLFDGLSVTYPLQQQGMRVNVMGGVPANTLVSAPSQRLGAAMLELDNITEHWGGNIYYLGQTTEGYLNRSALGTEIRYSDDVGSAYALLDYDTRFQALNALSVQGSMQGSGQTTYTVLLDTRRAPTLELNSALISAVFDQGQAATLKNLLARMTLDEAMDAARKTSAIARQLMFSVSRPLSEKWQATSDFRYSDIGALPAVGSFEATQATGAQYGLTLQLTGSNLYSKRDINNFNLSVLSTPMFNGVQLAYNNLTSILDNTVTVEPSIRVYSQRDAQEGTLMRVSPGIRLSYRLSKKASIMGESMLEHSKSTNKTSAGLNNDTINSVFFYFGYRYDLF